MRHAQRLLLLSTLLFSGASPLASPSVDVDQPTLTSASSPTRLITVPPRYPSQPPGGYRF